MAKKPARINLGPDDTPPQVSDGVITISGITETDFSLLINQASDEATSANGLIYKIYRANEDATLNTIQEVESLGSLVAQKKGETSADFSGLQPAEKLKVNVIVEDRRGNKSVYSQRFVQTEDNTSPTISNPTLLITNIGTTSFSVDFTSATDSPWNEQLIYTLYISDTNNLTTNAATVETNGEQKDFSVGNATLTANDLTAGNLYYTNIVVVDDNSNKSIYTQNSVTLSTVSTTSFSNTDFSLRQVSPKQSDSLDFSLSPNPINITSTVGANLVPSVITTANTAFFQKSVSYNLITSVPSVRVTTGSVVDSRAGDEQALNDIYNDLDGANWDTQKTITRWDPVNFPKTFDNTGSNTGWSSNMNLQDVANNGAYGVSVADVGGELRVTSLDLYMNNLEGTLPHSITNFSKCTYINIKQNIIMGTLPTNMPNLTSITDLYLEGVIEKEHPKASPDFPLYGGKGDQSSNNLTGDIPENFFNLPTLEYFEMSGRGFTGSIPASIGNATAMKKINMYDMAGISGTLPDELGNLSNATIVQFGGNFSGPLPASTLSGMVSVRKLGIGLNAGNYGPFPDIGGMTQIREVVLPSVNGDGSWTGPFPDYLFDGTMPDLINIYVWPGDWDAGETVPVETASFNPDLFTLNIALNSSVGPGLEGEFPWLQLFNTNENMENFDIRWNKFIGPIPSFKFVGNGSLRNFMFGANNFTGPIPELDWTNEGQSTLASGTVSSATSTTLVDSSASFGTDLNEYECIEITGGTGIGQVRSINSRVSTTELSLNRAWSTIPDGTSTYKITRWMLHDNTRMSFASNRHVFTDLLYLSDYNKPVFEWYADNFKEHEITHPSAVAFDYLGQQDFGEAATYNQAVGSSFTINNFDTVVTHADNQYQWYKDNSLISGATSRNLTISNAQTGDSGNYELRVTNSTFSTIVSNRSMTDMELNSKTISVNIT